MSAIVRSGLSTREFLVELLQRLAALFVHADRQDDEASTSFSWPRGL
jgi:hypothetical protein